MKTKSHSCMKRAPSDGDYGMSKLNARVCWEANTHLDAKEIHPCGDMNHLNHAPGWQGWHHCQRNGALQSWSWVWQKQDGNSQGESRWLWAAHYVLWTWRWLRGESWIWYLLKNLFHSVEPPKNKEQMLLLVRMEKRCLDMTECGWGRMSMTWVGPYKIFFYFFPNSVFSVLIFGNPIFFVFFFTHILLPKTLCFNVND